MPLHEIGSRLVLQGLSSYTSGLQTAQASTANFAGGIAATAGAVSTAGQSLQTFGSTLTNTGNFLQRTGFILSFQLTAPLLLLGRTVIGAATDFEDSFAGVRKTVNATEEEFARLERQLRDLALTIPIDINALNGIAEAAGQVGIASADIVSFTRTVADLTVATNLGEDAAIDLARIANITGTTEFPRLGSTLVDLGNNFAATESEIVNMSLRLAGAGTTIGLTTAEILGMATALASVGIRAEAGGSAFSRVFINIAQAVASGGEDLQNFAKVAGSTASEFAAQFERAPAEAITAFVAGLARIHDEGGNVFAVLEDLSLQEIRVRDALLRSASASELFTRAMDLGSEAWRENTALTEEAEKRYATTSSQLQLMRNEINDTAIDIGNIFLPSVLEAARDFADRVLEVAKAFQGLSSETQNSIIRFGLLAIALPPVITVLGALLSSLGLVIQFLGLLIRSGGALVRFIALLGQAILVAGPGAGLAGVLGALGGAIAAFGLALSGVGLIIAALATDFGGFRSNIIGLHDLLAIILRRAVDNYIGILKSLGAAVGEIFGVISAILSDLVGHFTEGFNDLGIAIQSKVNAWIPLLESFSRALRRLDVEGTQAMYSFIRNALDALGTAAGQFTQAGRDLVMGFIQGIQSGISSVVDTVQRMVGSAIQAARDTLQVGSPSLEFIKLAQTIPEGVVEGIEDGVAETKEAVRDLMTGVIEEAQAVVVPTIGELATHAILAQEAFKAWREEIKALVASGDIGAAAQAFLDIGASADNAVAAVQGLFEEIQAETARALEEANQEAERQMEEQRRIIQENAQRAAEAIIKVFGRGVGSTFDAVQVGLEEFAKAEWIKSMYDEIVQVTVQIQQALREGLDPTDIIAKAIPLFDAYRQAIGAIPGAVAEQTRQQQQALDLNRAIRHARGVSETWLETFREQTRIENEKLIQRREQELEKWGRLVRSGRDEGFEWDPVTGSVIARLPGISRIASPSGALEGTAQGGVNITVNATYTDPQEPQGIALDMQALAMQLNT